MDAVSTDPQEVADLEAAMAQRAEAIEETKRERLMAEGAEMSLDEAVLFALGQ